MKSNEALAHPIIVHPLIPALNDADSARLVLETAARGGRILSMRAGR